MATLAQPCTRTQPSLPTVRCGPPKTALYVVVWDQGVMAGVVVDELEALFIEGNTIAVFFVCNLPDGRQRRMNLRPR